MVQQIRVHFADFGLRTYVSSFLCSFLRNNAVSVTQVLHHNIIHMKNMIHQDHGIYSIEIFKILEDNAL